MKKYSIFIFIALFYSLLNLSSQEFPDLGIPLSKSDLDLVKAHINAGDEPWKSSFESLSKDWKTGYNYQMRGPRETVNRDPYNKEGLYEWSTDMDAIWKLSLMWYMTGDGRYAQKARDILIAWADTQKAMTGMEGNLELGDYSHAFAGGASILRGSWPEWTDEDTRKVKKLFLDVYWETAGAFKGILGPANKGGLSMQAAVAIAAFCNDQEKLDFLLNLLCRNSSSGFLNTLPNGQIGESARDQGHAHGQLRSYAFIGEVYWKRGIDIYSYLDNRLWAVGEYYSRKNMGAPNPYITYGTTDALYWEDHTEIWDGASWALHLLHNAYTLRKGMPMPYLDKLRERKMNDVGSFMFIKSSSDGSTATPLEEVEFPTTHPIEENELTSIDIGTASPAGSSKYENQIWSVTGSGREIWFSEEENDSFHFAYKEVYGDCSIIAKVESIENTAPNAKAGIMLRSDLTPKPQRKAWIAITPSQTAEAYARGWNDIYGGTNWEKPSRQIPEASYWVKIQRAGDLITMYNSRDGASWAVEVEAKYNNLPEKLYVGLAVCAINNGKLNTSTFSNVSITGGSGSIINRPEAPYALVASPGDSHVPLRWLSSYGATSYTVKRSKTPEGPYTTIASELTNMSFDDKNVHNGISYYYKVNAVNNIGESSDSPIYRVIPGSLETIKLPQGEINGVYNIVSSRSNKALEIVDASTVDGAKIQQYTKNGSKNQQWEITPINDTEYKVINTNSKRALCVENQSSNDASAIEQRTFNDNDPSQIWIIEQSQEDTYTFKGKQSGKMLDVDAASYNDGAKLILWHFTGGNNQRFILNPVIPEGFLKIEYSDENSTVISAVSTASGDMYFVLRKANDPTPTKEEIISGDFEAIGFERTTCEANRLRSVEFTNLEKEITYKAYMVIVNEYKSSSNILTIEFKTNLTDLRNSQQINSHTILSPNPAKNTTHLTFELDKESIVKGEIYSHDGKRVFIIKDQIYPPGKYGQSIDVSSLSKGAYILRLNINQSVESFKLIKN